MHSTTQSTYLVCIIGFPNLCTPPLNLHTWCPSLGAQICALGHTIYILGAHHWVPKYVHSATQSTYLVRIIGWPNLCTRPLNVHTWCPSSGAQIYALSHSIYILDVLHP